MRTVHIYTDGSCITQKGIGGWAIVSEDFEANGSKIGTTNNEMELYSILKAVEYGKDYDEVHIYSDSQYCIGTLTEWAYNWERNGWTRKGGIRNKELVQKIFYLIRDNPKFHFHKVKGHNGNEMNEKADRLARKSYKELV